MTDTPQPGQAGARKSILGSLEVDPLKVLDDAKNNIRQLFERYDNALSFEDCRVAKSYLDGHLVLLLDLECDTRREPHKVYATVTSDAIVNKSGLNTTVWLSDDDFWQRGNPDSQEQGVVLISDIEFVKPPKCVACPSLVRFHRFYEVDSFFAGSLYLSFKVGLKVVPIFMKREHSVRLDNAASGLNKSTGKMIERSAEVVHGVPSDRATVGGERLVEIDSEPDLTGLTIWMNDYSVRIGLDEVAQKRVKVRDVLIGPFDLEVAA
ncbi:MAG: hypothetical protein IIA72_09795 [Proteobacteria bacterium]|nr:hypothetical protein [Pseudomonadota bacterium]